MTHPQRPQAKSTSRSNGFIALGALGALGAIALFAPTASAGADADAGPSSVSSWSLEGTPRISFNASGPAGLKIEGKSEKLAFAGADGDLRFTAALADLDTGIGLRNRHMLEDLEAATHPSVELRLSTASVEPPSGDQTVDATVTGRWTLHGQSKEVPVKYRARCQAEVCDVQADATLDLKEFGVKIRSYLGITVKSAVPISVTLRLRRR